MFEDIENIDDLELPVIVIDFDALISGKEIDVVRLQFLKDAWQYFNIVVWRESRFFRGKYKKMEAEITRFYDLDYCIILECSLRKLCNYLRFNKTILLAEKGKYRDIKHRVYSCFEVRKLNDNFDAWARRNL